MPTSSMSPAREGCEHEDTVKPELARLPTCGLPSIVGKSLGRNDNENWKTGLNSTYEKRLVRLATQFDKT